MLTNKNDVLQQIMDGLEEFEINSEDEFSDALYQVVDDMIDIYTIDLFNSVEFLYEQGLLDEVHGDLLQAIRGAQYEYYTEVAGDNYDDLIAPTLWQVMIEQNENDEEDDNEA